MAGRKPPKVPPYVAQHRRSQDTITPEPRNPIEGSILEEPTRKLPTVRARSTTPRKAAPAKAPKGRTFKPKVYESKGRQVRQAASGAVSGAAADYAHRAAVRGSVSRPSVGGRAVAGAAAGAAAGAPLAPVTGGLSIPVGAAVGGAAGAVGGHKAKKAYDKSLRNPETGAARRVLLAEFAGCMLIAGLAPLAKKEDTPGRLVRQMTGLMLLFFVLALVSSGGRGAARAASAFGGLVLLVLALSQRDLFVKVAEIFNSEGGETRTSGGQNDQAQDRPDRGGVNNQATG